MQLDTDRPWFLSNYMADGFQAHIIVDSTDKLAFCSIAKVASTASRATFGMLGAPIHRQPSEFPPYVNAANGWSSFAFYRDPVDRFLSAWIHGCDGDHLSCRSVMDGEEAGKCIACLHALGSDPLSLTTLAP